MATIQELRLSFIFFEAFDDMLTMAQPDAAPMGFLARFPTYAGVIGQLLQAAPVPPNVPAEMSLPWTPGAGKNFWSLYLGPAASALTGKKAWDHVVPLRRRSTASIAAGWFNGRIAGEVLFYPHGVAFILTFSCPGPLTIAQATKVSLDIRENEKFQVAWPDQAPAHMKLDALGDAMLLKLRLEALGPNVPHAPYRPGKPFSVATVVRGNDITAADAPLQDSLIHQMLDTLTTWNPAWPKQPPPVLADRRLPTDSAATDDVLYASRRGRAAWIPSRFTPQVKQNRKMGCYHRNLTLASAHVESLAAICQTAAAAQDAGNAPQGAYLDLCSRATEVLGRLYGGARSTYRTASLRRHVDDNEWVAPINQIRQFCQRGPLT